MTQKDATPQELVLIALAMFVRPLPEHFTLQVVMEFFYKYPATFYEAAVIGVPEDAAPWAKEFVAIAQALRRHVRTSYEIVATGADEGEIRSANATPLQFAGIEPYNVRKFLAALNGIDVVGAHAPLPQGITIVPSAFVKFRHGELPPAP